MSVYFFLWNPKINPESFVDFDAVQEDAEGGVPYETDWICPSMKPEPVLVQRDLEESSRRVSDWSASC